MLGLPDFAIHLSRLDGTENPRGGRSFLSDGGRAVPNALAKRRPELQPVRRVPLPDQRRADEEHTMASPTEHDTGLTGGDRKPAQTSDMNPPKTAPLSDADPSVAPEWNEHVKEYFNDDAHPGEAQPTASHEAKE